MSAAPRYANITLLRAVAALLVVYDHLLAMGPERFLGAVSRPVALIREYVTGPLGIIQDGGWLAVVLFFLISGFIITHAGMRETRGQFAVRRVLRIYPPLACAIVLAGFAAWLTGERIYSAGELLLSMTLLNYLAVPQFAPLGVGWTLLIEVLFYAMTTALLGQLKARPALAVGVQLAAIWAVLALARTLGDGFFLFAASVAYLPYLVMGQVLYFVHARRMTATAGAAWTLAAYACVQLGIRTIHEGFLPLANSYLLSFAYAYLAFCIALQLRARLVLPRWIEKIADMSYSIYLLHGVVGLTALQLLVQRLPRQRMALFAIAMAMAAVWLCHRLVEKPSIALARRLTAPKKIAEKEKAGEPA